MGRHKNLETKLSKYSDMIYRGSISAPGLGEYYYVYGDRCYVEYTLKGMLQWIKENECDIATAEIETIFEYGWRKIKRFFGTPWWKAACRKKHTMVTSKRRCRRRAK